MQGKFIRRWIPTRERLRANPSLRWLGPLLDRPWLWQVNRRGVAAGVGIGVFFGFLTPILQIVFAAFFAVLLRANLPVAVASTLVTNPITYGPVFVSAYHVGAWILGESVDKAQVSAIAAGSHDTSGAARTWRERITAIGKPFMVGLATFAIIGGTVAYFMTLLLWRLVTVLRVRKRKERAATVAKTATRERDAG